MEYVWLGTQPLAVIHSGPSSAVVYYIHTDHLNTPQVVSDNQGTVIWRADYDAFGQAAVAPGSILTFNLRFPDQYFDSETGLHYNYYRDYDPATGRYIESDPIGLAGGLNSYAYVQNNPANWLDPWGLYTEIVQWGRSPGFTGRWGHLSGNVNGKNWSYGPHGWDTKYPTFSDYANRQADPDIDRGGRGIVLDLTPEEEAQLQQCIQGYDDYNGITNNCGSPWVGCLEKLGVVDSSDKARVLPYDIYKIINSSPRVKGNIYYPGAHNPVGYESN